MIQTSEQINDLAAALAKAQVEIENVAKDGANPHFQSRYATLGGVLEEVRPKLAKHGISVVQMPVNGEGSSVGIITRLLHSSGQWIESAFFVVPTKHDAQGAGSALTYCRRYSLMAMAGVGPEDDDGNAAVAQAAPQRSGMVRAADVPPTNGSASKKPAEHPLRQQALDAYSRIKAAIEDARTPKTIDEIIHLNGADLKIVKEVHSETYNLLMSLASTRKQEMYASA